MQGNCRCLFESSRLRDTWSRGASLEASCTDNSAVPEINFELNLKTNEKKNSFYTSVDTDISSSIV